MRSCRRWGWSMTTWSPATDTVSSNKKGDGRGERYVTVHRIVPLPSPRSLYFALSKYSPDRGSTLTVSPGEINSGTCTVTPLDNFAGLVLAVFVAVFITGDVSTTFSSITDGSSMAMGRPSNHSTCTTISGCNQGVSSPTARSSSVNCSYVC